MGINDLLPYLKKLNSNIVKKSSLDKFYNKRIGIDAYYWLYSNMSIAQKGVLRNTNVLETEPDREKVFKILVNMFLDFYVKLCSLNIQLVLCFDGSHNKSKQDTIDKRKAEKDKIRAKISALESKLECKDILEKNESDAEELRKLKAQLNWVTSEEIERFKNIVISLGIPYYQAKDEGEKLCAMLARAGITSATIGKDSDLLVYGNRFSLSQIRVEGQSITGMPFFSVFEIDLVQVLQTLELNYTQFIDFCIMLGTDHNTRIRGYGPVKSHGLIKTHKNVDNISLDKTCLNVELCRSEFKDVDYTDIILHGYHTLKPIDSNIISELEKLELSRYIDFIQHCHNNIIITESDKNVNNEFLSVNVIKPKLVLKLTGSK